jgi:hypothetical protein
MSASTKEVSGIRTSKKYITPKNKNELIDEISEIDREMSKRNTVLIGRSFDRILDELSSVGLDQQNLEEIFDSRFEKKTEPELDLYVSEPEITLKFDPESYEITKEKDIKIIETVKVAPAQTYQKGVFFPTFWGSLGVPGVTSDYAFNRNAAWASVSAGFKGGNPLFSTLLSMTFSCFFALFAMSYLVWYGRGIEIINPVLSFFGTLTTFGLLMTSITSAKQR